MPTPWVNGLPEWSSVCTASANDGRSQRVRSTVGSSFWAASLTDFDAGLARADQVEQQQMVVDDEAVQLALPRFVSSAHGPHAADVAGVASAIGGVIHQHQFAGHQGAIVAVVVHVPDVGAAGDDRPVAAAGGAVELVDVLGDGAELPFEQARRGGAHGLGDRQAQ